VVIVGPYSSLPEAQLLDRVRRLGVDERAALLLAYVGDRHNRRHKPGRAFERTGYRFDVLGDYGACLVHSLGVLDAPCHCGIEVQWRLVRELSIPQWDDADDSCKIYVRL